MKTKTFGDLRLFLPESGDRRSGDMRSPFMEVGPWDDRGRPLTAFTLKADFVNAIAEWAKRQQFHEDLLDVLSDEYMYGKLRDAVLRDENHLYDMYLEVLEDRAETPFVIALANWERKLGEHRGE